MNFTPRIFFIIIVFIVYALPFKGMAQSDPEKLLLKDYRPKSIYKVPKSKIEKARFSLIDMHSHAYAKGPEAIDEWVKNMDKVGIEKTILLTKEIGAKFDSIYQAYAGKYPDRFEVWCGFDYAGYDKPGYGPAAVAELERCYKVGARGVGELGDKGKGLFYCDTKAWGMHLDDPRMDPLLNKCAELNMPINIHVADPIWMYEPMDETNDGLMNAYEWRLDDQPDIVGHGGMIKILANAVKRHPETTFIACHFANCSHDLMILGNLLDQYPNLYADNSARYAETGPIPRFVAQFYEKFQDRIVYGTDMGYNTSMYQTTFRILESFDEHFYAYDQFGYHWSLYGFGLDEKILKKVYRENAIKIISH
jgi:predicted TIM-barrel fold metal-dependent hydrolase